MKNLQQSLAANALKNRLQQFGLNPNDWILNKKTESIAIIKNKENPDLLLKGLIDLKTSKWKSLQLVAF